MVSLIQLFVHILVRTTCYKQHNCFVFFSKMLLEFRVPLPYCVEDPNIGYLYMVMEACRNATGGGEGVEWLEEVE